MTDRADSELITAESGAVGPKQRGKFCLVLIPDPAPYRTLH